MKHLSVSYDRSARHHPYQRGYRSPVGICFKRQHVVPIPRLAIEHHQLPVGVCRTATSRSTWRTPLESAKENLGCRRRPCTALLTASEVPHRFFTAVSQFPSGICAFLADRRSPAHHRRQLALLVPTRQRWAMRGISSDVDGAITFVSRVVSGERINLRASGHCAGRGPKPRDADAKHILILMIASAYTLPCCLRNGHRVSASRRSTAASSAVAASRAREMARCSLVPGVRCWTFGTVGRRRGYSLGLGSGSSRVT